MATTSNTQSVLREYYQWETADFPWTSQQCNEHVSLFGIYDHTQATTESVDAAEVKSNRPKKAFAVTITVGELATKQANHTAKEEIEIVESYWDNIGKLLYVMEKLGITDSYASYVDKVSNDSVAVDDERTMRFSQQTEELLVVADLLLRQFASIRQYDESLEASDGLYHAVGQVSSDELYVDESFTQQTRKNISEQVNVAELLSHIAAVKRQFEESVVARDTHSGRYRDKQKELLSILDSFLKACQGVIADVGIYNGGITLDDFKKMINQPSGYEPFIPYVVGEYEYQQALVRLLIKAGSAGSQPAVYDAIVNVDIDDTIDRGSVDITNTSAATKVHFNKHYYTKPEVAVTLQGGNTANGIITPNIVTIDSDNEGFYFTVELLKSNGTRTTGRISWNSVGY